MVGRLLCSIGWHRFRHPFLSVGPCLRCKAWYEYDEEKGYGVRKE